MTSEELASESPSRHHRLELCWTLVLASGEIFLSQDLGRLLGPEEICTLQAFCALLQESSAIRLKMALDDLAEEADTLELSLSFHSLRPAVYRCLLTPLHSGQRTLMIQAHMHPAMQVLEAQQQEWEAQRFQAIYEHGFISIGITDGFGRLIDCNPAFCELMGRPRSQLIGLSFKDFTLGEDLERQLPLMEQLIQREIDSFRIEKRNNRADGTCFWIDLMVTALRDPAGHSVNFIGFATDITQRKQLETELAERQQLINSLFEYAPMLMGVVQLEGDDYRYLIANPLAASFDGRVQADLEGHLAREINISEESRQYWLARHREVCSSGQVQQFPHEFIRPGQPARMLQVTLIPLPGSSQRVCYLVEELHAPRRQAEARRSQMQQAQQELFNQLAHDVRNALSSVGGFSQLLRRRKLVSGEAEAVVGRIQQAAEEAHQLLQEMLFARELELGDASGDGKLQLEQVIQDTLRWFGIQAREKELSFVGQVDQELPLPAIPPAWFERLLKQLLGNALRFTPAGGEIRLRLSAPAGKLLLVVSDTGPGIPADMQPRLFEKVMLRDQRAGGMELYLAQQIVHQHGGRLWFESNAGAGTTFFLELPPL
ncbi:MAG: PAS domain S-box protein [Candidatus Sericytochromatia bacterium]